MPSDVMGKSIHFRDYHVSSKTGFLLENLKEYLPAYFEPWNRLAKCMPALAGCGDESLKEAYNRCLEALTEFRTYHIQLVTKYVIIAAKRDDHGNDYQSLATKGTGGTDLLPFLKELRDDTKQDITRTKLQPEYDVI